MKTSAFIAVIVPKQTYHGAVIRLSVPGLWLICLMLSTEAAAQQEGPFIETLRLYHRDRGAGISRVLQLTRSEVSTGVRRCLQAVDFSTNTLRCTPRQLMAGALMLADGAGLVADDSLAVSFVRSGEELLKPFASDEGLPKDTPASAHAFAPAWFAHAARLLLARRDAREAGKTVGDGLNRYPRSTELQLASGILTTVAASWSAPDGRGDFAGSYDYSVVSRRVDPALTRAARAFEDVLVIEPSHARARLWLGWRYVLGNDGRAKETLAQALRDGQDADTRYQIHLARAAFAEHEHDWPTALHEYAMARSEGPRYTAACVGLSHAQTMTGEAEAGRTAVECLRLPQDDEHPDPWLGFRFGIPDTSTSEWLATAIREP